MLVEFFVTWCGDCRRLAPVLDRLAEEWADRMVFVKVNADESPELVGRYGVSSTPTLIILDAGEPVASIVGAQPEPMIRALITVALDHRRGQQPQNGPLAWVPADACTLPTAEKALRVAEFDDLFATAVKSVDRPDAGHLRLELTADPAVAARVADLAVRETDCCGFFTFTLTATDGRVLLDVAVPDGRADVLDVLASRANAGVKS